MFIRPATIDELLSPAGHALFKRHHAEIGLAVFGTDESAPLDLDTRSWRVADALGQLLMLGVFTDADELVGYAVGCVTNHPMVRTRNVVCSRALFLAPEHRKRGLGSKLIDAFELSAASLYDAVVHWYAHAGSDFDRLLDKSGLRKLETVYVSKPR